MARPDDTNRYDAGDPHDEFEAMIGDLPMREPSRMLDERIAQTLHNEPALAGHAAPIRWRYVAALVSAAAGIALGAVLLIDAYTHEPLPDTTPRLVQEDELPGETVDPDNPPSVAPTDQTPTDPAPAIEPVHLTWTRDLAQQTRHTPSGRPYQAVVREVVDQRTWHDPETGQTLQVNTPRQEMIVVSQMTF